MGKPNFTGPLLLFFILLQFIGAKELFSAGGQRVLYREISPYSRPAQTPVEGYLVFVRGRFLSLGKVVKVRVRGRELAVLNAVHLSRGHFVKVSSALLEQGRGRMEFSGPSGPGWGLPWNVSVEKSVPIYRLPVNGPLESGGVFAFRFESRDVRNSFTFRLESDVSPGGIQVSLNELPLQAIGKGPNGRWIGSVQTVTLPSGMLKESNLLILKSAVRGRPFKIRDPRITAAVPLPSSRAYGWAPEIGLGGPRRIVEYSFPPRSGDLILSFQVYDADSPDEVEVRMNGNFLSILGEGTSDDRWSDPIELNVPGEYLHLAQKNILSFSNRYNHKRRYHWGIREVCLSVPVDAVKPGGYDPIGGSSLIFQFDGRPGAVSVSYEASGIRAGEEVKISVNGTPVSTVAPEDLLVNADDSTNGNRSRLLFIEESLVHDEGLNYITFRNTGKPDTNREWAIRGVSVAEAPYTAQFRVEGEPVLRLSREDEIPEGARPIVLNVDSTPRGASVFLSSVPGFEGMKLGEAPVTFESTKPMWAYLTLRNKGFQDRHARIYLNEGSWTTFKTGLLPFADIEFDDPRIVVRQGIALPVDAEYLRPFPVDFNSDGIFDLVCGSREGLVYYLENRTVEPGKIDFEDASALPAGDGFVRVQGSSSPVAVDWNDDGEVDLLVGDEKGKIYFFKGGPGETYGWFESPEPIIAGGDELNVGSCAAPFVLDFNEDGKQDLLVGNGFGKLFLFLNTAGEGEPPSLMVGLPLRVELPDTSYNMNVVPVDFADWTGDGRPDLVVVTMIGHYYLLENRSDESPPIFKGATLQEKLSNEDFLGVYPAPAFIDFDWDGVGDLVVGNAAGEIWFLRGK